MSTFSLQDILVIIACGLAATAVMTLFLYAVKWIHVIDSNLLTTVGALFTRSHRDYTRLGLAIHFVAGIIFSLIYVGFWRLIGINQPIEYVALGTAFGLFHGLIASYVLVIFAVESHPERKVRRAGIGGAAIDWMAHVIYGGVLGFLYAVYLFA